MSKCLVVDIEGNYGSNINPWNPGSYVSLVGFRSGDLADSTPKPICERTWVFCHNEVKDIDSSRNLREMQQMIDNVDIIVGHNLKFDLNWLKSLGLKFNESHKFFCTMIAEYLIYGQQKVGYSLNSCAERYGHPSKLDEVLAYWEQGVETYEIPLKTLTEYNLKDLEITESVMMSQIPVIQAAGLTNIARLSMEITNILSDTELHGIGLDVESAHKYIAQFEEEVEKVDADLNKLLGVAIDVNSKAQLAAALYGGTYKTDGIETYTITLKNGTVKEKSRKVRVDVELTGIGFTAGAEQLSKKTGKPSTSKDAIKQLEPRTDTQRSVLELLEKRSQMFKALTTMTSTSKGNKTGLINKVGVDGRVHPTFNQCVTATGRLSSTDPNGQNFPRKKTSPVKKILTPSAGNVVVNLDLAQIEFRAAAALSEDPVMCHEINNGIDTHRENAIEFFKADPDFPTFDDVRTTAKIVTFRLLYGGTHKGFVRDWKMPKLGEQKWKEIVAGYAKKYYGLTAWQANNIIEAKKNDYLRSPSGRLLTFKKEISFDGTIVHNRRQIYNFPVQSISTDIMYLAMVSLHRAIKEAGLTAKMMLQVHDAMVFDCPKHEVRTLCALAVKTFEDLPNTIEKEWGWKLPIPLTGDCEVGYTYGSLEKAKVQDGDKTFAFLEDVDAFLSPTLDKPNEEIIIDIYDEDDVDYTEELLGYDESNV